MVWPCLVQIHYLLILPLLFVYPGIVSLMKYAINIGAQVVLFPFVLEGGYDLGDEKITNNVYKKISDYERHNVYICRQTNPMIIKSMMECLTILIGSRMHSNILALSVATPVLAISYLPKTNGIMDMLGLADWVKCPVVALHGDYDPHPAEGVEAPLSERLDDFRFCLLQNCGHKPWIERGARAEFYRVLGRELLEPSS